MTPQQARALRDAIAIGQSFADILQQLRASGSVIFDRDGAGPGHVVIPEDIAQHGQLVGVGGFVADLRGWYRSLDELRYALPEADVPYPDGPAIGPDDTAANDSPGDVW